MFRVQTSAKEYSFLEDDLEQVRQLLWCIVNKAETTNDEYRIDSYLLDVIPRLSDEFVTAVFDVPSGQTKKSQRDESIENGSQQKVDPFQNLDTEVQGSENRSTEKSGCAKIEGFKIEKVGRPKRVVPLFFLFFLGRLKKLF